ncbi:MAG: hypothetical protein IBX58_17050 [Roseovarius sp.]|nr:hypothetical protein [Roseovarius sp.]
MTDTNMTNEQFQQIIQRLERMDQRIGHVEDNMVRKSDVFQSVLTVQAFTAAAIVGTVVVLNAIGAFG